MNRLQTNNSQSGVAAKAKNSFLASNPVMRRLDKVNEHDESHSATYGGIAFKTVYFLLFCVVGIVLQRLLNDTFATGEMLDFTISKFAVSLYTGEALAILAVVILGVVFQLVATFARPTTPVVGALYCITQGYFISFLVFKVLKGYEHLGALALAITLVIILAMSILYTTGVIRVSKKFKMVMVTLFVTMIASSILVFIGSLLPFTRELVVRIQSNLVFSIIVGVIFIIIAALFLICDFATIDRVVNDKLPKKYEWSAAFGLAFTVIWLYLKVLDLIMTIAGSRKN